MRNFCPKRAFSFIFLLPALSTISFTLTAQTLAPLTVEKIMRDPKWMGVAPSNPYWSEDGTKIFFSWNPEKNTGDSLYVYKPASKQTRKVTPLERSLLPTATGNYNRLFTQKLFVRDGDIFWTDVKTGQIRQLTNTVEIESNVTFSGDESKAVFRRGLNLFALHLMTGELVQLTNFLPGTKKAEAAANEQDKWLKKDQLALFDVLKERADKKKEGEKIAKSNQPKRPKEIYTNDAILDNIVLSPTADFITYRATKGGSGAKTAIVPNYVTESGYTEDLPARPKVGAAPNTSQLFVYNIKKDTVLEASTKDLTGINVKPDYLKDYKADTAKKATPRKVQFVSVRWSEDGKYLVVMMRSLDNKDRWIASLDPTTAKFKVLDHLRDEAWVGGPGSFWLDWVDNETVIFHSEATGYSHLYTVNVRTGERKALTSGKFEVQQAQLSKDKKTIYFQSNEVHPGEQHFYKMAVTGGERTKLTKMVGANDVTLSPDESKLLIRYSSATKPWELYVQDAQPGAAATQITQSLSPEFSSYAWKEPQIITVKASDGTDIYARLYVPKKKNGAAVVFVHGAGYLQNAHKWWSQYFREYMFHNLLVDLGYTVLDMDYRASAGYGRDVRTGIYRFMGGKDLDDNVDGAKYLVAKHGIDAKRIGIYGGSYGGFITLMAMFTKPGVFKAGAALRPVTDWAAYNHPYTANILNEPATDSLAYRRSSPIYHAAGLKDHLLICHGMVDVNVHIQDSYRLVQRLIELKKDNWEMASYPMEDHGFVEASSWTDEYKRILKLFQERLK
ncbi:prolyl oligopeptidase family serine peptidase [Runella slithyformis]|uniref:Peptidase S9 prolyl oligopeptidase active site domain protein n=1 Tax=Runella slithyformis (strain ATCC 29530 / DSM 19594 / LMG 11500 / NCIMB 11436 / LSU 4) TaxID=761193 RepID=A0A7U3ZR94_RUNSL|nr:peptidase S9 prolyl oligopeptidase active site domain protein [Runella slithyformis DSM 19594]